MAILCAGVSQPSRIELRQLALVRLKEARRLRDLGLWDGAYYLAGYAVECGLKASIAAQWPDEVFPPKDECPGVYIHNPVHLVVHANLSDSLKRELAASPQFASNWGVVSDWHESSRYARHPERLALDMVRAVGHPQHGVLKWIRRNW